MDLRINLKRKGDILMLLRQDATKEKLAGRYFTPVDLANYIVEWATSNDIHITNVLEPSCGEGVFLKSLVEHNLHLECSIKGIEIDEAVSIIANDTTRNSIRYNNFEDYIRCQEMDNNGCYIINDDFYKAYREGLTDERFQAIIGNPPYIRYQYLDEDQRDEQSIILTNNGMRSNKLINAWVSFKCWMRIVELG